jgi:hypothetical protein
VEILSRKPFLPKSGKLKLRLSAWYNIGEVNSMSNDFNGMVYRVETLPANMALDLQAATTGLDEVLKTIEKVAPTLRFDPNPYGEDGQPKATARPSEPNAQTGERWSFSVNGVEQVGVIRGEYIRSDTTGTWHLAVNCKLLKRLDADDDETEPLSAKSELSVIRAAAELLTRKYGRKSPVTKKGLTL